MIKFYGVNALEAKSLVTKVYAAVDSSGVQMYYSFYSDGILMTDERAKNLFYSVIFKQLPDNPDTNIYRRLSHIDTLVFSKAKELVKTLNNLYLKNPDGATGFEIQVQYMHGFPKKGKFLPL